jgi:hypothetical protein
VNIADYLKTVNKRYQNGISREHSYRADLEQLIRSLVPDVEVTNEPANVTDCGNPDYVISNKKIPIGYIEAKDVGKDLNSKSYKEQFTRYKNALDNLIITDYVWFQLHHSCTLYVHHPLHQLYKYLQILMLRILATFCIAIWLSATYDYQ